MLAIAVVLAAAAGLCAAAATVLFGQVVLALIPQRRSASREGPRPRVAVLVPAHDEASVISEAIATLLPQLRAGDRLVVVADNCTDDTAAVAAAAGASVVERHDTKHRGKSHALEFGMRSLAAGPPDVVVVVDADCLAEAGAIDRLAREAAALQRPVQGRYEMLAPPGAPLTAKVAQFAWLLKNVIRPLGMRRAGLPCLLAGSGTAFPWAVARAVAFHNTEMAEDYRLGIDVALAGFAPQFCPEARVWSRFPAQERAARGQRTRWEHGHLHLIAHHVPSLLLTALRRRDRPLAALATDLMVPPLSLLALALPALGAAGAALALASGIVAPLALALAGALLLTAATAIAWARWGSAVLRPRELLQVPAYVLSKIPLYARYVTQRQTAWLKTERD
jgi:cellulose synthase/poly-beta-1,6-N-acetylglucosamine synthase-like glycosyltransferase